MQYGTSFEGDIYFLNKLLTEPWDSATEEQHNRALSEATILIDQLRFSGSKTDPEQLLEFPRNGETEVPQKIKNACFEIAFSLLDGVSTDLEHQNLAITSDGYSSVRATYNRITVPEHFASGIPSRLAWLFLRPFLADVQAVKLRRV
jgi:hypothetical protein